MGVMCGFAGQVCKYGATVLDGEEEKEEEELKLVKRRRSVSKQTVLRRPIDGMMAGIGWAK